MKRWSSASRSAVGLKWRPRTRSWVKAVAGDVDDPPAESLRRRMHGAARLHALGVIRQNHRRYLHDRKLRLRVQIEQRNQAAVIPGVVRRIVAAARNSLRLPFIDQGRRKFAGRPCACTRCPESGPAPRPPRTRLGARSGRSRTSRRCRSSGHELTTNRSGFSSRSARPIARAAFDQGELEIRRVLRAGRASARAARRRRRSRLRS